MNFINIFPTLDLFIIFLFVVAVLLHLIFIKKTKLLLCFISVYTSFALLVVVPIFSSKVLAWLQIHSYTRVTAFVGLTIIIYILLSFSNLASFSQKVFPTQFITSLIYRIAITGLFFTTVLYFLSDNLTNQLGVLTHTLFLNLIALVIWFVIPFFLAFEYRFHTRRGWVE